MKQCKVIATFEELQALGIDYDISGLSGQIKEEYANNWYRVRVVHKIIDRDFANDFSIPRRYLETIKQPTQ